MRVDLDAITIEQFGGMLRRRDISSLELTEHCLKRIADDNRRLNAFILVTADQARADARRADAELASGHDRGPLHGVPISVKDLIDVAGTPTTAASRVRDGHRAARDAEVIAHLRRAGAVIVGKTNLHEFAFGTTTEESAFGAAANPRDVTRSPGGSSGGSAISVVAGMALASIGTDTGGSVRIPAAACGCAGLKPTFGEVSVDGVVPLSGTCDHVGPLTRSAADASLVYRVCAGALSPIEITRTSSLSGVRVGVLRDYFCDPLDDGVRAQFEASLDRLRTKGAQIDDDVAIRHAPEIAAVYLTIVFSDAAAYHASTLESMPDRYTPPVRTRLEVGRYILAEDFSRALRGRAVLRREVDDALVGRDALVLPTLPIPAPVMGAQTVDVGSHKEPTRSVMLRNTQLFNMTGHPAISLPCGVTPSGMPCGLQLVGRRRETAALVQLAIGCEGVLRLG
jgi:aspartyl-tRNA(Asn)/glutamyl-tRNA(Gln) amidotransferase subunit A